MKTYTTPKKYAKYFEYIREHILDADISYRGGILKVDISGLLSDKSNEAINEAGEDATAGAKQNYLGGGIAGAITAGRMFDIELLTKPDQKKYKDIAEALKIYFFKLNSGGGDDYMVENVNNYKQNQKLPKSGY